MCKAKFDEASQVETKMTALKNEKYDELIVPNTYYCTFMEGTGQQAAVRLKKFDCDGHEIIMKEAKNPSDILWLNRGVSRSSQVWRGIIVMLVISIVSTIIYFLFQFEIGLQIYILYRRKPPGVICSVLYETYGELRMSFFASLEYLYLKQIQDDKSDLQDKISTQGSLACFCEHEADLGNPADELYPVYFAETRTIEEPICKRQMMFTSLLGWGSILSYFLSTMIVV